MTPEQQRAMALAAARRRRAEAEGQQAEQQGNNDDGFMSWLNRGIASTLGAPVDVINAGLGAIGVPVSDEPFGGSRSIASGMEALGIQTPQEGSRPQNVASALAEGLGGAAGALIPGAGIVGAMSRAASPVTRGVARTVAEPFTSTPTRAIAAELTAGAGAGAGAQVGREVAPESQTAEIVGALIGGLTPASAAAISPLTNGLKAVASREIAPFTKAGATERARRRIQSLSENPEAAAQALRQESIADLSPAVQTGDRRLMALEQTVRDANPTADLAMRDAEEAASQLLRQEARTPAGGADISATQEYIGGRLGNISERINRNIQEALDNARQRVEAVTPERRPAASSVIVREELEAARASARRRESELWGQVPREETVPTTRAREAFREIEAETPMAQRDAIPSRASEFLGIGNRAFRDNESVAEMHGLYSALREESRIARSAGENNRARISDILADAILDDMNSAASVSQPLRNAIDYSRQFHDTFTRGNVGRVLGSERTGGSRVAPEMTLDATMGRQGIAGAVAMDDLERALTGRNPEAAGAMEDYLRRQFSDTAIRDGNINPRRGQDFVRRNEEMLERAPTAQNDIARALSETETAARTQDRLGGRLEGVENPSRSIAAALSGARPGDEIQAILRSRDPQAAAAQLVRQTRRNPEARSGLKGAVLDDLMGSARTGQFSESGEAILSGRAMIRRIEDDRFGPVLSEILTPEELSRTRQIADELRKVETMQGRLPDVGPIMGDEPNSILAYFARVMAARSGAALGAGSSGASLQTASMASNRMKRMLDSLTNDRAEALIEQAITGDKELFESLLTSPANITREQESRIAGVLAGITGQQIAEENE